MENALLVFLRGSTPVVPFVGAPTCTPFVGLFTTQPADTGTTGGTADGTEVTTTSTLHLGYTNYARQAASLSGSSIVAATGDTTGQQIANTAQIAFPAINTTVDVIVTGVGIWSLVTAGNLLYWITLTSPVTYVTGSVPTINVGGLTLAID